MRIRFWGARGSIPVCGQQYLKYGGDTTCLEIRTRDDQVIIVDAGSGIRHLGNRLIAEGRNEFALIFTHAHLDHVIGFPFLKPIYSPDTRIDLYGCPFAQESIHKMIARTMSAPTFPVNFEDADAVFTDHGYCAAGFRVGSVQVTPIILSHPNEGLGYSFAEDGKR
ncbi:MAG: MBL fold metallo-hydrolase, partial [Vicinamibacteria bacterium]|nr:MBL fold metallo-hydrolase [Vicinamibacteria bacterium]